MENDLLFNNEDFEHERSAPATLEHCPIVGCGHISRTASEAKRHRLKHEKPIKCQDPSCKRHPGFTTINDRYSHQKSVHKINRNTKRHKCAVSECRNKDKEWQRLDNFKQHVVLMHPNEDLEEIVKMSQVNRKSDLQYANTDGGPDLRGHNLGFQNRLQLQGTRKRNGDADQDSPLYFNQNAYSRYRPSRTSISMTGATANHQRVEEVATTQSRFKNDLVSPSTGLLVTPAPSLSLLDIEADFHTGRPGLALPSYSSPALTVEEAPLAQGGVADEQHKTDLLGGVDVRLRWATNGRITCSHCNEYPDGFHGEHELRRHIDRKHTRARKVWVIVDASADGKFLANCKQCRDQKQYGAYYNAAAHLRRAHFHPRKRGRKGKPDVEELGGESHDPPPMDHLKKHWMKEIEIVLPTESLDIAGTVRGTARVPKE